MQHIGVRIPVKATSQIVSIQYARASAALLVVYAHLFGFSSFDHTNLPAFGGIGVDLFFVISGFLMWQTTGEVSAQKFLMRRIARIVPAYWFYTLILVAISILAPKLTPRVNFNFAEFVASLLFIPYTDTQGRPNPILLQGWTLNYEMYFYALFAISLCLQRKRRFVAITSLIISGPIVGLFIESDSAWISMATSPMLIDFFFGLTLACWLNKFGEIRPAIAFAFVSLGISCLIASDLALEPSKLRNLVCGVSATFFLGGLISLETIIRRRPLKWLLLIGNISYSLYLCHPFALNASDVFLRKIRSLGFLHESVLPWTFASLAIGFSIAIAWISFNFVEQASSRRFYMRGKSANVLKAAVPDNGVVTKND